MKTWMTAAFLLIGGLAYAQQAPKADEKDLTPEEALAMLKEVQGLMVKSEDLLNDSSRGKAAETEAEILKRVNELLKDDPEASQKKILEKIAKLMEKTEGKQKESVDKIEEVIRRAKKCGGGSCNKPGEQQGPPKPGQPKPAQQPGSPAPAPYDPGRNSEPINKFRGNADRTGNWGNLPPRIREAMLNHKRSLDDFPAEYQQVLKEYMKRLADEKD
ncbi:MAG TPA: hypothetical protein VE981_07340 [Planctomycetota bacterium]|nr:hypothetical protein [Planctomycetota bacterium]